VCVLPPVWAARAPVSKLVTCVLPPVWTARAPVSRTPSGYLVGARLPDAFNSLYWIPVLLAPFLALQYQSLL